MQNSQGCPHVWTPPEETGKLKRNPFSSLIYLSQACEENPAGCGRAQAQWPADPRRRRGHPSRLGDGPAGRREPAGVGAGREGLPQKGSLHEGTEGACGASRGRARTAGGLEPMRTERLGVGPSQAGKGTSSWEPLGPLTSASLLHEMGKGRWTPRI